MIASTLAPERAADAPWDAVVVGAGPAGALAARELARSGARVLLVDRARFPRGKVCGACLGPTALGALRAAGLGALPGRLGARPLEALALCAGGRRLRLALGEIRVLSRRALDAALVRAAVEAGAEHLGEVRAELGAPGRATRRVTLHAGGTAVPVEARLVVAADGLASECLRATGTPWRTARGSRIGAGAVVAAGALHDADDPRTVTMVVDRGGYAGFARQEDGALAVAAALDPELVRRSGGPGAAVARLLADAGLPSDGLAEAPWRGTPVLTRRPARPFAGRVLAVGDAAGYVEPFTGEGIGWALAGARALAAFAAGAPWSTNAERVGRAWERELARVVGRRRLACRAVAALLRRPGPFAALVGLAARVPALAAAAVRFGQGGVPVLESREARP